MYGPTVSASAPSQSMSQAGSHGRCTDANKVHREDNCASAARENAPLLADLLQPKVTIPPCSPRSFSQFFHRSSPADPCTPASDGCLCIPSKLRRRQVAKCLAGWTFHSHSGLRPHRSRFVVRFGSVPMRKSELLRNSCSHDHQCSSLDFMPNSHANEIDICIR